MALMLDMTLDNLPLPGVGNFENEFGTKKPIGTGISTKELAEKDMLVFRQQRAFLVEENAEVETTVQSDRKIIVSRGGIVLDLKHASYAGCSVVVDAGFESGSSEIRFDTRDGRKKILNLFAGGGYELRSDAEGFFSVKSANMAFRIPTAAPLDNEGSIPEGSIWIE